jgi:hypothetical protein
MMWCSVRLKPQLQSFGIAAATAVVLQFIAFKSFVYTVPLFAFFIVAPFEGEQLSRGKRAFAASLGAAVAFAVLALIYLRAGLWDGFLTGGHGIAAVSSGGHKFGPGKALMQFLTQTPLLAALCTAALITFGINLISDRKRAFNWRGCAPECLLFAIASFGLLLNPTPFQYNLLNLVPFAFLLAFRYGSELSTEVRNYPALIPACLTIVLFAHLVPFGFATQRHLDWPNTRQVSLMQRAEDLTDPATDPVYDAIGLVPTRHTIDPRSFLHSLSVESFTKGPGPQVRDMLAANPAAVLIPSYRTDWLPELDHEFIAQHYVALADDFWVLGTVLPGGGGSFNVIHPGRYRISSKQSSDLSGTYPEGIQGLFTPEQDGCLAGTIDGVPVSNRPVFLTSGTHRIECAAGTEAAIVWVGPYVDRVHRIGSGDHHFLFVNGY